MNDLEIEVIAIDEQNRNYNTWGGCGTLTTDGSSPKHNNRVMEIDMAEEEIYNKALNTTPKDSNIRIRKLTPCECYKLMGFSEEDYKRASAVNSNTQLYKQAGNSIVVNVLMAIFKQML